MSLESVRIYGLLLTGTVCAAGGQILFKLGATGRVDLRSFLNGWIALGLMSYGIGTILWIYVLSRAPLSLAYPFTALTFVLVYFAGVWWFGEAISRQGLLGLCFVLFGLFLVTSS